jgi:hypothetical protein
MAGRVDKTGSGPGRTGASSVTRSPDRSLADHRAVFIGPTGQIMDTKGRADQWVRPDEHNTATNHQPSHTYNQIIPADRRSPGRS